MRAQDDSTLLDEVWPQLTDFSGAADSGTKTYINQKTGDVSRYILGNVKREIIIGSNRVRLMCDRLYIHGLGVFKGKDVSASGDSKEEDELQFYFYADGNVRLDLSAQGSTIEAASVYYDHRRGEGVIRQARIRSSTTGLKGIMNSMELRDLKGTSAPGASAGTGAEVEVLLSIDVLRTTNFESFTGQGIKLSNCDYAEPHLALAADSADIRPVGGGAGAVDGDPAHYLVDLSGARLEILGKKILPLPLTHWDTRWQDYLPLRSVDFGSSSKFGFFGSAEWNMNFFLDQLPLASIPVLGPGLESTRLGFETTHMARRGFGWGPIAEYGRRAGAREPWQLGPRGAGYYGAGRYFSIHDDASVDRFGAEPILEPDRYWGSLVHRHEFSGFGTLDIEYSGQSDPNFLNEYFEAVAKEEKEQESLVSWRGNYGDNLQVSALYKYQVNDQVNDFDQTIERLPELELDWYQQPVFDSGLYMDLRASAVNLRHRGADAPFDQRHGRLDIFNSWSYPVSELNPYLAVRPFAFARYTGYEKTVDPSEILIDDYTDRTVFGSGMTISQQWSRTFPTGSGGMLQDLFGVDSLKHLVVPEVSYLNIFSSDLSPPETFEVDEVDAFDVTQRFSLSLRQALVTRFDDRGRGEAERPLLGLRNTALKPSSFRRRHLLDSEVSLVFYPDEVRDNEGDELSLLVLDHTLRASDSLSFRSWIALDPNDGFSDERMDNSVRAEVIPGLFSATLGDVSADSLDTAKPDSNFVYGLLSFYPHEKWRAQLYWARNIQSEKDSEFSLTIGRVFHRYALFFEYSFDAGEDDNQTFSVNFRPVGFSGGGPRSW
ncbi:MAG: LPS assembly protein LptD, partial [Planctomycetota bacterium]|nr:LPS assembly protein LptD [Planctomycetota bacterium]